MFKTPVVRDDDYKKCMHRKKKEFKSSFFVRPEDRAPYSDEEFSGTKSEGDVANNSSPPAALFAKKSVIDENRIIAGLWKSLVENHTLIGLSDAAKAFIREQLEAIEKAHKKALKRVAKQQLKDHVGYTCH